MIKSIFLLLYVLIAGILPIFTIIISKAKKKVILVILGGIVYSFGSFFLFVFNSMGINLYLYSGLSSLLIGSVTFFAGKYLMHGCTDEDAMTEYGGFALFNTFLTKLITYVPLIMMGFGVNNQSALEAYLTSKETLAIYNNYLSIGIFEIFVAILNMTTTFFILRVVFVRLTVLSNIRSYIEYIIITFIMYAVGYSINNSLLAFGINLCELVLVIIYLSKTKKKVC